MASAEPSVPSLSDGVIALDGFTLADVADHLAGEDEEQARRFGWHPARSTPETVRAAILAWQAEWRSGGPTRAFAVRDVATGLLVGGCELRLRDAGHAELSYWVFPAHRRRGIATRAVRLVLEYAARELGVATVELQIAPDNTASRGVARRAGFVETGRLPAGTDDPTARPMVRYVATTAITMSQPCDDDGRE